MNSPAWRRYIAEGFGTFCMVFVGTGAIIVDDVSDGSITHLGIAIAFGLIVMAMIYATGDVSGAHINPAVTVAFWVARRLETTHVIPYLLAQFLGAICASLVLKGLFVDHLTLGATLPAGSWLQAFVLEVIITSILMFVILSVATGAKERGIMAAITIGGVVAMFALTIGPITGASMNPARSLGPALVSGKLKYMLIYMLAPVIGSVLSIVFSRLIHGPTLTEADDEKPSDAEPAEKTFKLASGSETLESLHK